MKIKFSIILFISFFCLGKSQSFITFENKTSKEVSFHFNFGNYVDNNLTEGDKITVPKNKILSKKPSNDSIYLRCVEIDGFITYLYVKKNEDLQISIYKDSLTFKGKSANINAYFFKIRKKLNNWELYNEFVKIKTSSIKNAVFKIDLFFEKELKQLSNLKLNKKITEEEYALAKELIDLKILISVITVPYDVGNNRSELILEFFKRSNPFEFNVNFHDISDLMTICSHYSKFISEGKISGELNDMGFYNKEYDLSHLNYAPTAIQKKYFIHMLLQEIKYHSKTPENTIKAYEKLQQKFPNDMEVLYLKKYIDALSNTKPKVQSNTIENYTVIKYKEDGTFSENTYTDVEFTDFLSKEFTKEQYVLFDLWATWCKPCVDDFAYLPEGKIILSDNDIGLLFINMDKPTNIEKAKNLIKTHKLYGKHLFISQNNYTGLKKLLGINDIALSLPQRFLLNKQLQIINSKFPSFKNKEEVKEISEALKK